MHIATIPPRPARPEPASPSRQAIPPEKKRSLVRVLLQGMEAAADYRRLEAMPDGQLAAYGLTLILEASRSCGSIYRVKTTLDLYVLGWLMRSIGL